MAKTTTRRSKKRNDARDFDSLTDAERQKLKSADINRRKIEQFRHRYYQWDLRQIRNAAEFYNQLRGGLKKLVCDLAGVSTSSMRGLDKVPLIPLSLFEKWVDGGLNESHLKCLANALAKTDEQKEKERWDEIVQLADLAIQDDWSHGDLSKAIFPPDPDVVKREEARECFARLAKALSAVLTEKEDTLNRIYENYHRGDTGEVKYTLVENNYEQLASMVLKIAKTPGLSLKRGEDD